jgi:hypothetical protein
MLTGMKINCKYYEETEIITENMFANTRTYIFINKKRISIERLSLMQIAQDYYNRRIKDISMMNYYFEAYKYFYTNKEHLDEMNKYRFGETFEKTLLLNKPMIQLYEETDPRECMRRIESV